MQFFVTKSNHRTPPQTFSQSLDNNFSLLKSPDGSHRWGEADQSFTGSAPLALVTVPRDINLDEKDGGWTKLAQALEPLISGKCMNCSRERIFLCQIDTPEVTGNRRMLYLFTCPDFCIEGWRALRGVYRTNQSNIYYEQCYQEPPKSAIEAVAFSLDDLLSSNLSAPEVPQMVRSSIIPTGSLIGVGYPSQIKGNWLEFNEREDKEEIVPLPIESDALESADEEHDTDSEYDCVGIMNEIKGNCHSAIGVYYDGSSRKRADGQRELWARGEELQKCIHCNAELVDELEIFLGAFCDQLINVDDSILIVSVMSCSSSCGEPTDEWGINFVDENVLVSILPRDLRDDLPPTEIVLGCL